jgi:hypothetical protein
MYLPFEPSQIKAYFFLVDLVNSLTVRGLWKSCYEQEGKLQHLTRTEQGVEVCLSIATAKEIDKAPCNLSIQLHATSAIGVDAYREVSVSVRSILPDEIEACYNAVLGQVLIGRSAVSEGLRKPKEAMFKMWIVANEEHDFQNTTTTITGDGPSAAESIWRVFDSEREAALWQLDDIADRVKGLREQVADEESLGWPTDDFVIHEIREVSVSLDRKLLVFDDGSQYEL